MSNIEHALISRVITDQDFHSLEKAQITEEFFSVPEVRQVYRFLKEAFHHPQHPGLVPSIEMVRTYFPSFYHFQAADPVPILANRLRYEKMRTDLLILAQDLHTKAEANPLEALATLRQESAKLSALAETGSDLSMASSFHMLRERYETVAQAGGVIGIPYPWDPLNEETQGMQGGQFIVWYGRPKSMKTWVGLYCACDAYLRSRRRVMFYTREMPPEQIAMRTASLMAKVDYKKFKNGQLQPDVKEHVFEILQSLEAAEVSAGAFGYTQPYFTIVTDRSAGGRGGGGVSWLQSKIRELQPDIVFVDGMYLMRDDRSNQRTIDWKAIAHISQDLKLTSQEFNIPLVGITQANRGAEKAKGDDLTELAFSDALGQDADAVFRVMKKEIIDENTKQKRTELTIRAPGLREGTFDGIVINGSPGSDFSYLRTLQTTDVVEENEYKSRGGDGGGQARSAFRRSGAAPNPVTPLR